MTLFFLSRTLEAFSERQSNGGRGLRNSELVFIIFFRFKKSETQGTWMRPGDEQRIKSWHDDKSSSSSTTTTTTTPSSSTNQEK